MRAHLAGAADGRGVAPYLRRWQLLALTDSILCRAQQTVTTALHGVFDAGELEKLKEKVDTMHML